MLKQTIVIIMLAVGMLPHSQAFADNEPNRLLLQQEITVESGMKQVVVPILLENTNSIAGYQCDLYLPDGFSVSTDEYGDYMVEMERTTARRHNVDMRRLDNGCLRILCSSMTNATFSGNSGTVLTITLDISDAVSAGEYVVDLKNVVMTDPQATRYTSSDTKSVITIPSFTIGDVNGDGSISVTDVGMMISFILGQNPVGFNEDAADLNGDGTISVTDVGALITKILQGN